MPRARKTMAGQPGQPVNAVQGQTYGEGVAQENLQRAMPAPQATGPQAVQPSVSTPGPESQPAPRPSLEDIMGNIRGQGGLLYAPDDKPQIPVTDGLPTGPGRGPEAFSGQSSTGRTLRRLAAQTGDQFFLELAAKANM